jgi:hypothetical protein
MFATAAIIGKRSSKSVCVKEFSRTRNERHICHKCESSKLQTKCTQLTPEMHTEDRILSRRRTTVVLTCSFLRFIFLRALAKDQIRSYYDILEPPVKGHNRFFDFENHWSRAYIIPYPDLPIPGSKNDNHPMLEQTVKKNFIY